MGSALDYLRNAAASVAGMFLAPFIFCKLKLAVRQARFMNAAPR